MVLAVKGVYYTALIKWAQLYLATATSVAINQRTRARGRLTKFQLYDENKYSCFGISCLRLWEKLTRHCGKLIWIMVVFTVA